MNAGGMPNTCKSNGVYTTELFGGKMYKLSGGRVSNAWVTCPVLGDNSQKWLLIPHKPVVSHDTTGKALVVQDGPASD